MKHKIAWILSGILLLGMLAGCGTENPTASVSNGPDEIKENFQAAENIEAVDTFSLAYNEADGLDPISCTSAENQIITQLCFQRLFVLDSAFQPQKVLCDTIEQTGERAYTLTIRPDIKFHSGQDVMPKDVVYSLNNARLREDSIYKDQLSNISSVKYNGDEIHIRLYEANANLAALLDIPIFRKGTEQDVCPDGSGPYQLVTTDSESSLIPFSQWEYGEVGFCKSITLEPVSGSEGAANLLSNGDLSILFQPDAKSDTVQGAKYVASLPTTRMHYLGINCGIAPFDDENVRTALSLLFDRASISQTCFTGRADAASLPMVSLPEGIEPLSFDKDTALHLLEQAGIYDRDGDGYLDIGRRQQFKLEIIYNEKYSTKGAVLQQYAGILNEAGISAAISPLSFEECQRQLRQESFQLYYGEYKMTADFNLSSLISKNGERNFGSYSNSKMESALRSFCSAGEEEREEACKEYLECFMKQTPIIPIVFERAQIASSDALPSQFDPWPSDIFHGIETWSAS